MCTKFETLLSVDTCENVKKRDLCDYKDNCWGLEKIDPPVPFPFMPKKIMVVGDSISHGADSDWTWRYRVWQWRKLIVPSFKNLSDLT